MPTAIVKNRLDVIEEAAPCKGGVETLLVLLPGAYDAPEDFRRHGFVEALRAQRIAADAMLADAHAGYYTAGCIVERLHQDLVMPARARGYRRIWLVGISLGGYGSLLYARRHGEQLDGMFLMAPFLGNRSLIAEVGMAGLAHWQAGAIAAHDEDRALWSWLGGYCHEPQRRPPLYLGYGRDDRFARSNRILAEALPPDRVNTTDGGHAWPPWRALWQAFLARGVVPRYGGDGA